jgi:hypothetical protein
MNNIEIIDGVKGEWRTVTCGCQVSIGQYIRREGVNTFYGASDYNRQKVDSKRGRYICLVNKDGAPDSSDIFDGTWKKVQAFFPLADKHKRKVAKVTLHGVTQVLVTIRFTVCKEKLIHRMLRNSRKSALRGARRFCKAIGYEMEVVK